ncbi:MAG: DUF697 domain-containing protein [Flavobacteriales bacterium]|nr:DUF697 domain-containing protein [Flavobacteriales bacterium]
MPDKKEETVEPDKEKQSARRRQREKEEKEEQDFEDFMDDEDEKNHRPQTRQEKADDIVSNSMMWTGAAGIIPLPIVDTITIAAFQLVMLNKIGKLYSHEEFSDNWGKELIASITASYLGTTVGKSIGKKIFEGIPVVGPILKFAVAPGFAAASTWALGKVFIMHFESGGTMLTFDPDKMRKYYRKFFRRKTARAKVK